MISSMAAVAVALRATRTLRARLRGTPAWQSSEAATVPLLCQEARTLLVAECRKVVKGESARSRSGGFYEAPYCFSIGS